MRSLFRKMVFSAAAALVMSSFAAVAHAQSAGALAGSYRLDRSASEDSQSILDNTAGRQSVSDRDLADLSDKLEAPETIIIGISGSRVTLETSLGGSATAIDADGVARSSVRPDGSSVSVRAAFRGDSLTISSLGGNSDYTLTFTPMDNGQRLRVTRRITTQYLPETIFAESVYNRTGGGSVGITDESEDNDSYTPVGNDDSSSSSDDRPYSSSDDNRPYSSSDPDDFPARSGNSPQPRRVGNGSFAVPAGTVLKGKLENPITTKASQENDPFRITVESPSEFGGAVIEGYITGIERTGKITGKSSLTLNFTSITFADGRRYDFAGVLSEARTINGDEVSVNNEGEIQGGSRTKETLKRGGVGAGLGAIIGGILGGGKGALIGATIGAGAGAGSMIPGGRGDLELEPGTLLTITSTGPGGR